jgi:DNA-binding transcriptional ArsR family regulator
MLDQVIHAISVPNRRKILDLLRGKELSAGQIAAQFDVTRPAISQHLQILREAGLLEMRRRGTSRLYRMRAEGTSELLEFLRSFWDQRLEALKEAAELEERRKGKDEGRRSDDDR